MEPQEHGILLNALPSVVEQIGIGTGEHVLSEAKQYNPLIELQELVPQAQSTVFSISPLSLLTFSHSIPGLQVLEEAEQYRPFSDVHVVDPQKHVSAFATAALVLVHTGAVMQMQG